MDFCYRRTGRPIAAAGALALFMGGAAGVQVAKAQDAAAAQAAPAKNYKDRAEYDLYLKITQTTDAKARLELLNTWQDKYPQTDYSTERLTYYVATLGQLAGPDPTQRQPLLTKCQDLLKVDAQNFRAMYFTALYGPAVGGTSPAPDLVSQVETGAKGAIGLADATFDPAKTKGDPAQMDTAKKQSVAIAHNALAWVAASKKDNATTESEYIASLTSNPEQGNISALLAKLYYDEKKYPEALFEYARASQYAGPGLSLPAAARTQLGDFFNKSYKDFHGSAEGADQVLAQAKTAALPPAGFTIGSAQDAAKKDADALQKRMDTDPAFKLWYTIEQNLVGDAGPKFFESSMKDTEVPGGANGVQNFSGTVISIDPADRPTKVTLGVEDPAKADAALVFSQPLPAAALDKIKVGQKLDFSGAADGFTKDPFVLTFKDPAIPGVQTSAPAKKPIRRHK